MTGPPRALLVFDSGCRSCARFAAVVGRLDRGRLVEFASMHDPAVEGLLRPRLGDAYDGSFHLVLEGGARVVSGEEALEDLARLLPWVGPLVLPLFHLPIARRVPAALYRSFAAGRACAAPSAPAAPA